MGNCQGKKMSKPEDKTSESAKPTIKPSLKTKIPASQNQSPENGKEEDPSSPSNKKKVSIVSKEHLKSQLDVTATYREKFDEYAEKFMSACFNGDEIEASLIIKKYKIKDLSQIKGYQGNVILGKGVAQKSYNMDNWNPLLLCLSQKHMTVCLVLFQQILSFHRLNCISKPYGLEEQKTAIYDHSKRLKRECFGLKITILNQDEHIFKYLWHDRRIFWNMGHFFVCLKLIVKSNWETGLKILLASTTSKVIFMSVNNFIDFVDVIDLLKLELSQYDEMNPIMAKKVRECFYSRPYYIFCYFLEIASYDDEPNEKFLKECLEFIPQDDIQLKHSDISEVFDIFGEENEHDHLKTQFLAMFDNKDQQIEILQTQMCTMLQEEETKDTETLLDMLDRLDLFAFSEVLINNRRTNALIEALNRGFDTIIDYAFNDGYINVRSILKRNNLFEIENDIASFNVSYFTKHFQNPRTMKKIFYYVVDLLQLSNFLEIIDYALDMKTGKVLEFILKDVQFKSLFITSLEFQKYIFVKEIVTMFEAQKQDALLDILQDEPYLDYYFNLKKGYNGEEFTINTLRYLQQLAQEKQGLTNVTEQQKDEYLKQKQDRMIKIQQTTLGQVRMTINSEIANQHRNTYQQYVNQSMDEELKNDNPFILNSNSKVPQKRRSTVMLIGAETETKSPTFKQLTQSNNKSMDTFKQAQQNQYSNLTSKSNSAMAISSPILESPSQNKSQISISQPFQYMKKQTVLLKEDSTKTQDGFSQLAIKELKNKTIPSIIEEPFNNNSANTSLLCTDSEQSSAIASKKDMPQQVGIRPMNKSNQYQSQMLSQEPVREREEIVVIIDSGRPHEIKQLELGPDEKKFKENQMNINQEIDCQDIKIEMIDKSEQSPNMKKIRSLSNINGKLPDLSPLAIDEEDEEVNSSQRLPQAIQKQQNYFERPTEQLQTDARSLSQNSITQTYENIPQQIIDCIKENNINKLKFQLKKHNIKNIANLKSYENTKLQTKSDVYSHKSQLPDQQHDTALWNPLLYAIFYQRIEILKFLMEEHVVNFILALRLPPTNEFTEYITPNNNTQKVNEGWNEQRNFDSSVVVEAGGDILMGSKSALCFNIYNPTDAKVQCFGLELAIKNKDIQTLGFLWNTYQDRWEERHFAVVLEHILAEHWDLALGLIFRSKTSHVIFKSLTPEDKDNFLFSKIIDKVIGSEFWENTSQNVKITDKQQNIVLTELSYDPYGSYAVLKFPQLFQKYGLLEANIKKVTFDDLQDFVIARKENVIHFSNFVTHYSTNSKVENDKTVTFMKTLMKQSQKLQAKQDQPNPEKIIQLIKLGDLAGIKRYFEQSDNYMLLEMLGQLQGFEDKDYIKNFQSNVKYVPADEIIKLLLADNSTSDWNPLIFAIFYQKMDIVQFFCEHQSVFVRNCLVKPFLMEPDDDGADAEDEEKFILEKSELFCLIICVMVQNREIFRYLLKKCAYIWNDIHLVLLANYVFESTWSEGVKVLFNSTNTHQIFNAMNLYEKEKFLKFCDRSVSKVNTQMLKDFRYQMSFDPYHIFYLPILITQEEIQYWDKEISKELFLKNIQLNFDEKSFAQLMRFNNHYVNEFITTAINADSESLINFAKKLKRYTNVVPVARISQKML